MIAKENRCCVDIEVLNKLFFEFFKQLFSVVVICFIDLMFIFIDYKIVSSNGRVNSALFC